MLKKWQVMISKSHDIYTNLAWENWLYREMDFTNTNLLLLWRNKPCVVIGRYQNPWKEVNVSMLEEAGVSLARRNSGGGTVYHDLGNLNFTFMTDRKLYNRRTNLEFIVKVLREQFDIPAVVTPRDDIIVRDKLKISGTAAKLGRTTAYHHCTLLVNVEKHQLHAVLRPNNKGIHTNASPSVPSPTVNLNEINQSLISSDLINTFAHEYNQQNSSTATNIVHIDPSEADYPGITAATNDLNTHKFVYGNTPKFNIIRDFHLPASLHGTDSVTFGLDILVEKGKIESFTLTGSMSPSLTAAAEAALSAVVECDFAGDGMWQALSAGFNSSTPAALPVGNVRDMARDFVLRCIVRALSLQE